MGHDRRDVLPVLRLLTEADQKCVDDATVRRYLRAYVNDTHAAAKALAETLRWRRETRPQHRVCGACSADPLSHNMRVVGVDRMERPVIYSCFSQALHRSNATHNVDHLLRNLEDAVAVMNSRAASGKDDPGSWVILIDYYGYNWLVDTNPLTAVLAVKLLAHYPERLGRCIMVDPPSAFAGTWRVLRGIINEVTASKIVFTRVDDGSLERELSHWADASLQKWLLAETFENRLERNQNGKKMYWKAPCEDGAHDPRAELQFLSSPEFQLTLTSRLERGAPPLGPSQPLSAPAPATQAKPWFALGALTLPAVLVSLQTLGAPGSSWQVALALFVGICFAAPGYRAFSSQPPQAESKVAAAKCAAHAAHVTSSARVDSPPSYQKKSRLERQNPCLMWSCFPCWAEAE